MPSLEQRKEALDNVHRGEGTQAHLIGFGGVLLASQTDPTPQPPFPFQRFDMALPQLNFGRNRL